MVGFVQSLAVHKRMPVWLAIALTLGIFAAAHFLDFEKSGQPLAQDVAIEAPVRLDADGEFLVEAKEGAAGQSFRADAFQRGWSVEPAFAPANADATFLDNYFVVNVSDKSVASSAKELAKLSSVAYFEPNEIIEVEPSSKTQSLPQHQRPRYRSTVGHGGTEHGSLLQPARQTDTR